MSSEKMLNVHEDMSTWKELNKNTFETHCKTGIFTYILHFLD